jgi:creatinine amidohydrolase
VTLRAAELPWTEVKRLAAGGAVALLPVGSTEAHGPHLPLNVDVVIAEAVCLRAAALLEARGRRTLMFPAVAYGLTDFAASFSGTVSVPAEATTAYLAAVLAGIAGHGFGVVAAVNHHVEPAHFKVVHEAARRAAAQSGARVLAPDHRRPPFVAELGEEFTGGGSHAGLYETSLVLAAAPHLVREDVRLALPELEIDLPGAIKGGAKDFHACGGPDAYFGAPAKATREEGERLLERLATFTADAVAPG